METPLAYFSDFYVGDNLRRPPSKENKWFPVIQVGSTWNFCEISVCNALEPHGFVSYGWADPQAKLVLYEFRVDTRGLTKAQKEFYKKTFELMKRRAVIFAEILNKEK